MIQSERSNNATGWLNLQWTPFLVVLAVQSGLADNIVTCMIHGNDIALQQHKTHTRDKGILDMSANNGSKSCYGMCTQMKIILFQCIHQLAKIHQRVNSVSYCSPGTTIMYKLQFTMRSAPPT